MASDILVKVGADVSDFSRKMAESNRALSNFGKANQQTFDAFKRTGAVVTGAGIALAGGLGIAVKEAIKFEDSFAGVKKTVDATDVELAVLKKGFRDMAKEIPASVHEINAVGEAAGQLGIKTENILDFTRVMIDLGEATNLTSEEAATAFARFANIVGMSQKDFDKLGSTVVALGNNFATTEKEIVEMSLRLAGVGKQVGMSESDIMALSTAMSSVGIEAEAGGSAMSMAIKKMQNAVSSGGKDLDNFAKAAGMTSKEFADSFNKDPIRALDAFIKGLAKSGEEGENLNEILESVGIKGIREADTMLRLAGASDILSEAVDLASTAWEENTALSDEAEQRYETMASKLKILKNNVIDAAITFGDALMPAVSAAVEWLQKLADWFNGLSDNTKTFIAVGAAVASVLMIVGGGLLLLIGFIPNIISGFTAIASVIRTVRKAMVVLNTAFLTNPIVLVIALIIAAVVGLAYIIYKYWDEIKEFTLKVWNAIVDFMSGLWERVKENWAIFVEWISNMWEGIKETAISIWESIVDTVMAIVQPFIDGILNLYENMKEGISTIFEGIKTFFEGVWEFIKNIFLGALLIIINLVTGKFDEAKENAQKIWDNIKESLAKIWEGIKKIFSGALDAVLGFIKGAWENIKTNTKSTFIWVRTTISYTWDRIKSFFRTTLTNIWNTVKQKFTDIVNSIRDKMNDVKQRVEDGWNKAVKFLKNIDLKQIGKDIIQGLINGIKSKINDVANAVKDVTDKITGKIKSILGIKSPSRVLKKIGEWTTEGFAIGIEDKVGLVARATEKIAEAATPDAPAISLAYDTPAGVRSSLASAVSGTVDVNASSRDEALIGAIDDLRRELTELRVDMDGVTVGRIVRHHVNDGNALDAVKRRYFD